MARKKKAPEHENHERWLVSYADFITLLFAFFVVMFASSQTDKTRRAQVSQSVRQALDGPGRLSSVISVILGGAVDDRGVGNAMMRGPGGAHKIVVEKKPAGRVVELTPSLQVLSRELKKEVEEGRIQISMEPRGLVVSFKEAALFPSGEAVITPEVYPTLAKIAAAINELPNPVRLEGHTDSVPIHTSRFRSNWDLSAARAISLLEALSTKYHVPTERMSIGGYADTAPIDSNATAEGRSRNRRVDIVILNQNGILGEPSSDQAIAATPPASSAQPQAARGSAAPPSAPRSSSTAPAPGSPKSVPPALRR
jgi:chemotaxis protein MotB